MPQIEIDPLTGAPIVPSTETGTTSRPAEPSDETPVTESTTTEPPVTESPIEPVVPPCTTEPPPVETSLPESLPEPSVSRKEECLAKLTAIEAKAGGFSNIGMNSEYWDLLNEYRSL